MRPEKLKSGSFFNPPDGRVLKLVSRSESVEGTMISNACRSVVLQFKRIYEQRSQHQLEETD